MHIQYINTLMFSLPVRFSIGFLSIGCIMLISWIWEFIIFKNEDSIRQSNLITLAKEAELMRLTQQLHPHFLFNSLNSISALMVLDPNEARNMIQKLSDFLRGTIKKSEEEMVDLEDDLKHLNLYLEIEKVRFGNRLNTVIACESELLTYKIPRLILQPILENAIKFGLYGVLEDVEIRIQVTKLDNNLKIDIFLNVN